MTLALKVEARGADFGNTWVILKFISEFLKIQDPSRVNVYDMVVFEGPPKTEQKMWPAHCVQGTWGSELHKDLKVILTDLTTEQEKIILRLGKEKVLII
jgi:nicotinamidase-related amidase